MILHFGMHKTGSSSIQQSLYQRLHDPHFYYVDLNFADAGGKIALAFGNDPEQSRAIHRRGWSRQEIERRREKIRESLVREFRHAQALGATAILSAEYISVMQDDEFRGLCEFIQGCDDHVTAVGYVRPPKAYMESVFQQLVQAGIESLDLAELYPNYRRCLEKFDSVLGVDKVHFWHFNPQSFPGGCVVQDFCRRLGIEFDAGSVIRANEGISRPAISLLLAYRKFGPGYGMGPAAIRENRLLVSQLAQLQGPKLYLHSGLVTPTLEAQKEDIAWMETRLCKSLAEDLARTDEHAVRSEEDLLVFTPQALQWLATQLGDEHADRWRPDTSAQEVAEWMHALRVALASKDERVPRTRQGDRTAGAKGSRS